MVQLFTSLSHFYTSWPTHGLFTIYVDRFYSYTGELTAVRKKTALIGAAWDNTNSVFEIVTAYYRKLCDYMSFQNQGIIEGRGCGTPGMTRSSKFMKAAYELGRALK